MEKLKKNYVDLYCNIFILWEQNGICIDTAPEAEIERFEKLQAAALKQSGLTLNELTLIKICRNYKIFKKVNTFANKQIDSLKK